MANFENIDLPAKINAAQVGGYLEPRFALDGLEEAVSLNELLQYILDMLGTGGLGEANTGSNLGIGQGVFAAKVAADLRFKSLVAGTNVTLSADGNSITINATGGSGEVNTASNLGPGDGIFASKVGADLRFKTLIPGANVTFDNEANTITINAAGGGGAGLEQYQATPITEVTDNGCFVTCTESGATYARTGGVGQNTEGTLRVPNGAILKGAAVHFSAAQAPGSTFYLNVDYLGTGKAVNGGENSLMPPFVTVTSKPNPFSDGSPATNYVHSGTPLQVGVTQVDDNGTRVRVRIKITNYNQQVGSNASILSVIFP